MIAPRGGGGLLAGVAAGCAVAAALTGRVRGKIVAIVSGGNIDLPKFASLVGACN